MRQEHQLLWNKIQAFQFDDDHTAFNFSDRLARENGWSMDYTQRVIGEYRKFVFLMTISEHPLSPSDAVDQVWHLHIIYTRSYWIDFCEKTLGKAVHHGPTKGGQRNSINLRIGTTRHWNYINNISENHLRTSGYQLLNVSERVIFSALICTKIGSFQNMVG